MFTTETRNSLAASQARAFQRAHEQKDAYSLFWLTVTLKERTGRVLVVPVCTVSKRDGTGQYEVVFRPQGVPTCSCEIAKRNRGTAYKCKHVLLAIENKRERDAEKARDEQMLRVLADRALWD